MNCFKGTRIAITGGTGSFGNAVLNRMIREGVDEVVVFSRDEKKQYDMRQKFSGKQVTFRIGDVRCVDSCIAAFGGMDFVFHAAALKQVPSCELFPSEAIATNVRGAENVLKACQVAGIKRVVMLSTDKAAYPVNVMGMTKALMEKLTIQSSASTCTAVVTRYGNVMASRGSVIPLFLSQMMRGKQVTVTDPNMTRFMMSLDDAVDLVLHALHSGNHGDLLVKKSPACTIALLFHVLSDLLKYRKPMEVIGFRQGEKLHETLLTSEERQMALEDELFFQVNRIPKKIEYENFESKGLKVCQNAAYTSETTHQLKYEELEELLLRLDVVQRAIDGVIPE